MVHHFPDGKCVSEKTEASQLPAKPLFFDVDSGAGEYAIHTAISEVPEEKRKFRKRRPAYQHIRKNLFGKPAECYSVPRL
jgi:hypothetical protein